LVSWEKRRKFHTAERMFHWMLKQMLVVVQMSEALSAREMVTKMKKLLSRIVMPPEM